MEDEKKMIEYSMIMGNYVVNIADSDRAGFKQSIATYMREKKLNYAGLAYLEQLEKNYVYHETGLVAMVDNINQFLLGMTKAPRKEDIELMVTEIKREKLDESLAHTRYLAFGCHGCQYHRNHSKYSHLRHLRLTDTNGYLAEIETGCQFFKACGVLSQICLISLWEQPDGLFGGTFNWDKRKMDAMLYQYMKYATSAVLNNAALRDDKGGLLNVITFD